jgi:signal transduction histidine kinase
MICPLYPEPTYFFFSSEVPALLYYAQIPATVVALLLSFYAFWNGKQLLLNRLLFLISIFFSFWTLATLIAWTNINSDLIIFVWSFFTLILGLISVFSVYFIYVFLEKKDVSSRLKFIFLSLLAPIIIIAPTYLNISGFDITRCDAFQFESLPLKIYGTGLGVLAMIWILVLLVRKYRVAASSIKKQIILMGVGIEFFLFSFFGMEFLATYLTKIGVLEDSGLELYGLVGMVVFMVYMSILIVRYGVFNIKLLATQALVWGLAILIGSQFFFIEVLTNFILNGVTFVGIIIFGQILVNSVKREVAQKERLQELSLNLEKSNLNLAEANEKLKGLDKLKTEFLSLASHQLRTPLTAIKGYASMLSEGAFGNLDEKQDGAVKRIYTSAQGLVNVVEDLLNVSKIEQGGMKYEFSPTNLSTLVTQLFNEMKVPAETKTLDFSLEMDPHDAFIVNADATKLKQVFLNLTDNSIKYTMKGFVKISLKREGSSIVFTVSDNGMGISPETRAKLFEKFSRGESGKTNTGGSGLGLYLAKQIVTAHKGEVTIESEGLGKGSKFIVTLPASSSYPN